MKLPIFNTYIKFCRHHFYCFKVVHLFVLDKSMAWNRCLQSRTRREGESVSVREANNHFTHNTEGL